MKSIITTLLFLSSIAVYSQRYVDTYDPKKTEVKSLLGKGNELNGFGGVDIKITELVSERGLITGGYGGVLVNRRFMLGVGGYGLTTNIEFDGMVGEEEKPLTLYGGYGGVVIGGMIASKEVIHLIFPVFFGAGQVEAADKNFFPNRPNDAEFTIESSAFMVIEPSAQVEVNVTEYFRLAAGMSYRYVTGSEMENLTDSQLSGSSVIVSLRFGRF